MEIKTVSIIGLGALGILFGNHLSKRMPKENLRIIADQERIIKYKNNHVYCNGQSCDFNKVAIPFEAETDMYKRLWGKFMLNVGVNQTVAVYETNYGGIQAEGEIRDVMIAAMREVILLSEKEAIYLTEKDLNYWLKVLGTLNPNGKPSMRQDMEAKRLSEVELFAGTVLKLGKKHNMMTPVNQMLYNRIKMMENTY